MKILDTENISNKFEVFAHPTVNLFSNEKGISCFLVLTDLGGVVPAILYILIIYSNDPISHRYTSINFNKIPILCSLSE